MTEICSDRCKKGKYCVSAEQEKCRAWMMEGMMMAGSLGSKE
jgi:hypothetical protein